MKLGIIATELIYHEKVILSDQLDNTIKHIEFGCKKTKTKTDN